MDWLGSDNFNQWVVFLASLGLLWWAVPSALHFFRRRRQFRALAARLGGTFQRRDEGLKDALAGAPLLKARIHGRVKVWNVVRAEREGWQLALFDTQRSGSEGSHNRTTVAAFRNPEGGLPALTLNAETGLVSPHAADPRLVKLFPNHGWVQSFFENQPLWSLESCENWLIAYRPQPEPDAGLEAFLEAAWTLARRLHRQLK